MPVKILDPERRAGWEPDTPVSDNLLRRFLCNQAGWATLEGGSIGARILQRDDFHGVDTGGPAGLSNMSFPLSPLYPEGLDETLAMLDDFYGFSSGDTSGEVFMFSAWPTPDLRLHGWRLGGHPPLMYRPTGGEAPPPPPNLQLEKVQSTGQLHDFESVLIRGFELHEMDGLEPGSTLGPSVLTDERAHLWIGRDGGEPVSAAASFVADGINNVTLVATVPEAQRRGYGAALTWRATLADPSLPAVLFASDAGRPVYERMGYISLFRMSFWWRPRGEQAATPA